MEETSKKVRQREIKDYLHLYLGCRLKIGEGTWADNSPHMFNAHLRSIEDGKGLPIKLVLRPLSSITDDEIKELFHWEKVRHEYKDISFDRWTVENRTTGVITLTGITMNYTIPTDEGDHAHSWTIEVSGMNAYDFKWCLSKGFDLFGLIEEGLAIDKTKSQGEIKTELI